ncbi:MAG TPA: polyhydroxyalkanoic acid system family protein, partial [Pirellulaceae bacterium]|nr:polyhydroxyalkanoic acid system family protein [Pirellulaceae bacterium]
DLDPAAAFAKVRPALEKTAQDFQGQDLQIEAGDTSATFSFKSLGFSITGQAQALAGEVLVNVDLPFAAMMFKDRAEKGIEKNVARALLNAN